MWISQRVSDSLNRCGARAAVLADRFLPDPWIYAVILTLIAYCGALLFTPSTPWMAALAWHEGQTVYPWALNLQL